MNLPNASFKFSDSGMAFIFNDALATLTSYTVGGSGGITFRSEDERDAFFAAVEQEQALLTADANTPWLDTVQEEDHKTDAWLEEEG